MLLAGITGLAPEVERLAELAARIAPDRIQLNTAVRPPAEAFVAPVADDMLQEFAALFTPHAEVIADIAPGDGERTAARADVLALLSRRPCTVADIAAGLGIHHGEALKAAAALVNEGAARASHPRRPVVLRRGRPPPLKTDEEESHEGAISAQGDDIDSLVDPGSVAPAGSSSPTPRSDEWQAHDNSANADASGRRRRAGGAAPWRRRASGR